MSWNATMICGECGDEVEWASTKVVSRRFARSVNYHGMTPVQEMVVCDHHADDDLTNWPDLRV